MLASDLAPWLVRAVAFVFGAIWGSFFNVAIHRWPRGMSVVSPPSTCPACGARIRAHHNIPIVGWTLLRGRAACCGGPISGRYPLVELLSALLCLALAELWIVRALPGTFLSDAAIEAVLYFAFVGGLLIATFVDLDWMEIPDEVSIPGAALGLATVTLRTEPGAADAALGAGMGFLLVQLLFVWAYEHLAGRRGMGEGDAKLLMMIGAFVGWRGVIFALVAGAGQGLIAAAVALATGRSLTPGDAESEADPDSEPEADPDSEADVPLGTGKLKMPFGPFLALGALEFLFFGDWVIDRYLALLG